MNRARRTATSLLLLAAWLAVPAVSLAEVARQDAPRFVALDRLAEGRVRRAKGQRRNALGPAVLNDVARPVPFLSEFRRVTGKCDPDTAPDAPCPLEVSQEGAARWVILEPILRAYPPETFLAMADHVQGPLPAPSVRLFDAKRQGPHPIVPAFETGNLRARLVFPMRTLWLESRQIPIPEHGVLRFSVGTEESTWGIDSAPVDFIVRAYVGNERQGAPIELFRTSLDPARRHEDRGWKDFEVPLAPLAGKVARLRFDTLPSNRRDPRPQLPLWGDPTVFAPASLRNKRPFVVLLSLDTLRARSLSAFGRELETSPFFDALAGQGTLFERAFTTYSNTLASHMSMLTGLWPRTHGVVDRSHLSPKKKTLAERLRGVGYETAAFTENALLNGSQGFRRGFSRYSENKEIQHGAGASEDTFTAALEWAREHVDTPFFLFIHTYQVHAPYEPHEPYAALYEAGAHDVDQHRRYEQEIRYLDDQLRRLVGELDGLLGAQELLLVITADHGEEFDEHGARLHTQLYDEVMHVPLLFRWPGHVPEGRRVATPVSLVDVAPTILQLAHVKKFHTPDGKTLTPLFRDGGEIGRSTVFGEVHPSYVTRHERQFVGRTARHKCFVTAQTPSGFCFDLVGDPNEQTRLPPETNADTKALLEAVLEYRGEAAREDDASADADLPTPGQEIDPKRSEKLRALGYVE